MQNLYRFSWLAMAICLFPVGALACAYPAPLRTLNTVLVDAQQAGGQVSIHHRDRLRRALGRMNPSVVRQGLAEQLGRSDLRAVDAVLAVSTALADGKGMQIDESLTRHTDRVAQGVQKECSGAGQAATGGQSAQTSEQGGRRGGGGAPFLTFREGITRLSVAFTIYAIFLAAVIALRRNQRAAQAQVQAPDDQVFTTPD